MKGRLGFAALALIALLSAPAGALTPEQNWIMGRWNCRIGVNFDHDHVLALRTRRVRR